MNKSINSDTSFDSNRKLFVENFPAKWTEKDLIRFFNVRDQLIGLQLH